MKRDFSFCKNTLPHLELYLINMNRYEIETHELKNQLNDQQNDHLYDALVLKIEALFALKSNVTELMMHEKDYLDAYTDGAFCMAKRLVMEMASNGVLFREHADQIKLGWTYNKPAILSEEIQAANEDNSQEDEENSREDEFFFRPDSASFFG